MSTLQVTIEGIGLWSPQLGDFAALGAALRGEEAIPPGARPAATTLPPNERRRAPESVLLAVEVAGQAVAMSGRAAGDLACVFSSGQGDQHITDYMCATLAQAPTELSPTKFHNSVHNAPVGYWTIATGCHAPSTAICAHRASFGAGLLEAAALVLADNRPVLLVCSDVAGRGPLGAATGCTEPFGCALLLAPAAASAPLGRLDITLSNEPPAPPVALPPMLDAMRDANPSAHALDLLATLARHGDACAVAASAHQSLQLGVEYDG